MFVDFIADIEQDNCSNGVSKNGTVKNDDDLKSTHNILVDVSSDESMKPKVKRIEFGAKNDKSFVKRTKSKGSVGKKQQCEVCRKVFHRSQLLLFHRRIHLDEFPIHCRICFYTFAEEKQRTFHENNCDKLRYECYVCKRTKTNRRDLENHIRTHSGIKPFSCKIAECNSSK